MWRFSVVLAPLIVAVIIAYLLNPIVNWVSKRSRFRRSVVAAIIYIGFLSVLILIPTLLAPLLVQQLSNLDFNVQGLSDELDNAMGTQINIAGFEVDIPSLVEPVTGSLDSIFSPLAAWAANLAVGIAGGLI